jgi:hypothetical protein
LADDHLVDFLGAIIATPDPPGVDLERWKQVIAGHPNLAPVSPRVGINPFTKGPFTYRPHPGTAWVVVDGEEVGMMSWAEDGTNQITVWGDSGAADDIAVGVAGQLGGEYQRHRG